MLESWPSLEKLRNETRMPIETLRAKAAESHLVGACGFEVPTLGGTFGVIASAHGVVSVLFPGFDAWDVAGRMERGRFAWGSTGRQVALEAGLELMGYLLGEVRQFETPVDLRHYTPFLRDVYGALLTVPYGGAITYGGLAALAGHPTKARAVGQAMHRNTSPIFIPCHRVVAARGALGGWSGPMGWKEELLLLESGAIARQLGQSAAS